MKKILILFLMFFVSSSSGEVISDFTNMCGVSGYKRFYAVPVSVTCTSGQFLPANAVTCYDCPDGYTCAGGTFTFNPTRAQGAVLTGTISSSTHNTCSTNLGHIMHGAWTVNAYTCSAGYYLPANVDSCTECPRNNYCTGGTYTFNEITNQGLEPCPINTPHAPTGSAVCYPHILHIGENNIYLKSTKLTTPSLNIAIEGSIFYANLTTTPTYMNKASEQSLKIMVNGIEYYVCDDTTLR